MNLLQDSLRTTRELTQELQQIYHDMLHSASKQYRQIKCIVKNKLLLFGGRARPHTLQIKYDEALLLAIRTLNYAKISELLQLGADVNLTSLNLITGTLVEAINALDKLPPASQNLQIIELLLQYRADTKFNAYTIENYHCPILIYVVLYTPKMDSKIKLKLISLLLAHGADINAEDTHHKTALCYAMRIGDDQIVKLFIEANANLEGAREVPLGDIPWDKKSKIQLLIENALRDRNVMNPH